MAEPKELTDEELQALASVTLPVTGYDVRRTEIEDDVVVIALPMELTDVNGEVFYIQPFLEKEDAEALAEAILTKTKEN